MRIRRSQVTGASSSHPIAAFLMLFISPILAVFFLGRNDRYKDRIKIRLPLCPACASLRKPEPEFVDFESRTMTFVVHKQFRARVQSQHELTRERA
jgi:hypothetical protein